MKIITPPDPIKLNSNRSIFLAGTIDMGNSEDWQKAFCDEFKEYPVNILNPRRDFWSPSISPKANDKQFSEQVNWELDALDKADIIVMNFLPDSKSPITLLELGLYANTEKLLVCCPDEFYRSGNVNIVCFRYGIPLFSTMKQLTKYIHHRRLL